jgi:hypothetical protein
MPHHAARILALIWLGIAALLMTTAWGANPQPASFDHFSTGFPLQGSHASVACEACHVRGLFKGTPRRCSGCHNGIVATGKSSQHIATTQECEICHDDQSTSWSIVGGFDHRGIVDNCVRCHNGTQAEGKSATHIASSDRCEACHESTLGWASQLTVDHKEVRGRCVSCHRQEQLRVRHIPVPPGSDCSLCHEPAPRTWSTARNFDHALVASLRCDGCHNGGFTSSGAEGKSATHIPTPAGADCRSCHKSTLAWAASVAVDHTGIVDNCARCHGVSATGKGPDHIPTPAGADCSVCHRIPPEAFATASLFDHGSVASMRCNQCHNGGFERQGVPGQGSKHVPIPPGSDCSLCHETPPQSFATAAKYSHTLVTSLRCEGCHNGAFIASGAEGKTPDHVATPPGDDCNTCHKSTSDWAANVTFDHTGIVDNCARCHGVTAVGKGTNHIPTPAGADCSVCHRIPPEPFGAATVFDHRSVGTMRCNQCHNGTFQRQGVPGQGAVHIPIPPGSDCNLCHETPPQSFATASNYSHDLVTALRCDGCHNGAFVSSGAQGKTPTHIATPAGEDCNTCHKSTSDWAANVTFDHAGIVDNCARCHGVTAIGKGSNHLPTPAAIDCGACHRIPPEPFATASLFNHAAVTSMRCDQCHSGAYESQGAPGPGTLHIPRPAGSDCNLCHGTPPQSFTAATAFSHTLVASLRCSQCHNGQFVASGAEGKGSNHFVTTLECDRCHTTAPGWAAPATLFRHQSAAYPGDHNASVTCASCHTTNSQTATWRNPALKPFCAGCHERDFDPGSHQKVVTPPTDYTAVELKDCTGACHEYSTPGGAIVRQRSGEHRPNAGGF